MEPIVPPPMIPALILPIAPPSRDVSSGGATLSIRAAGCQTWGEPSASRLVSVATSRLGSRVGNLLLAGTSLLLALLVAEVAFEVLDAHKQDKRSQRARPFYTWSVHTYAGHPVGSQRGLLKLMLHPLVGCVNLPDQTTQFFRINHLGFRGRELDPREQHRHRVVLVSGSAAFGTGLQSDAETLAVQLEQRLPDTEVVNAAVIGERSGQELSLLVSELVDLKPDQVMTLDGWNNFWAIQQEATPWPDVNGARQV